MTLLDLLEEIGDEELIAAHRLGDEGFTVLSNNTPASDVLGPFLGRRAGPEDSYGFLVCKNVGDVIVGPCRHTVHEVITEVFWRMKPFTGVALVLGPKALRDLSQILHAGDRFVCGSGFVEHRDLGLLWGNTGWGIYKAPRGSSRTSGCSTVTSSKPSYDSTGAP